MDLEADLPVASSGVPARVLDARMWLLDNVVALLKLTKGQTCPKDAQAQHSPQPQQSPPSLALAFPLSWGFVCLLWRGRNAA